VTYYQYTERFCEETNAKLGCNVCIEKLCIHKKSIRVPK
jgi:hypothetical protein